MQDEFIYERVCRKNGHQYQIYQRTATDPLYALCSACGDLIDLAIGKFTANDPGAVQVS